MKLSELKTGEKGIIVKVMGHGGFRKRIIEMGFIKGKEIEVLLNAPLQDPVKYKLMGYEVSLRHQEADNIEVVSGNSRSVEGGVWSENTPSAESAAESASEHTSLHTPPSTLLENPSPLPENPITRDELLNQGHTLATITALCKRGLLETYEQEVGRLNHGGEPHPERIKPLSPAQQEAYNQIQFSFLKKKVTLLHGVTSSGKTEIYIHLIQQALEIGRAHV